LNINQIDIHGKRGGWLYGCTLQLKVPIMNGTDVAKLIMTLSD
jgi:hypothetical protein